MSLFFDPADMARAKSSAEADERESPLAVSRSDVPWSINAVTREWLDDTIGRGAGNAAITEAEVTPFSSGTSVRGTIRVTREGAEPLHLFAKTYPSFEHRVANVLTSTAQAEGRFYMEIRPKLSIEAPRGYYWDADEQRLRAIVVIEDLSALRGATFCDSESSISRPEIESAVKLLAGLHGKFLGDGGVMTTFPWLTSYADWSSAVLHMNAEHLRAMEEAGDLVPSSLRDAGQAIFDKFSEQRAYLPPTGATVIHSDVHLGNWYKTQDGPLGLCDWQCVTVGDSCRDLAYAISTLLETDDRRAWEDDLVTLYAEELEVVSGQRIDRDAIFLGYRRWMPAALLMWTPTLVPAPDFPAMQPREMSLKMIQRTTAAIADLESLNVI